MDKKDMQVGMEVWIKPRDQCNPIGSLNTDCWDDRYFDTKAVITLVLNGQYAGEHMAELRFPATEETGIALFHAWIDSPAAMSPKELVSWVKRERNGTS